MSAVDYCICIEELARVDPSIALSVAAHNGLCTAHLSMFGNDAQKQTLPAARWSKGEVLGAWGLTEASAGSDAAAHADHGAPRRRVLGPERQPSSSSRTARSAA